MVFLFFKEISLKEQLLEKMEKDLSMFKRKFSVILHQKVDTLPVSSNTFVLIVHSGNAM